MSRTLSNQSVRYPKHCDINCDCFIRSGLIKDKETVTDLSRQATVIKILTFNQSIYKQVTMVCKKTVNIKCKFHFDH